jgi:organic radical activating enzyme
MSSAARIIEVFPSIQGEGIYVGQAHLFVRFWNCNMGCHYCDTDYLGPSVEYTQEELSADVQFFLQREGPFDAVSLTGGEPLLWWRFLRQWLPWAKGIGQRTYLETNGTLPMALQEVVPWIDTIAMDLKPPSATADRAMWREHEEFLRIGTQAGRDLFVKIVVTRQTRDNELQQAFQLVAKIDARIPVVLQPVTPWGFVQESVDEDQLARWCLRAEEILTDVRIIPQVHRMLGVP